MASNGRKFDALVVFSQSIRYLKDKAIEIIREVTGDEGYNAMDIQWVLTVPAIWKPAAKQFMREAAYVVNYVRIFFFRFLPLFLSLFLPTFSLVLSFQEMKQRSIARKRKHENLICHYQIMGEIYQE